MTKPTPHGQVPEALRQAAWLKKEGASCQRHYDLGVLIERQHTELETLREKLKTYEDLDEAGSDVQLLRAGYAAARLEIESLQARIKTMAEEHADELMVAHLDGRMRAAQPAGAQQPDTAYAELPSYEHQRAIMEAERNASLDEYSRIVPLTSTESMIYERAFTNGWNRHASHGQAPAQAAPQQEAASVDLKTMELAESVGLIGPASRTHDLHAAIQRFHDLICANATIKAAAMAVEVISGVSAHQWDTGYPPLPDFDTVEQHIYGACRRYITQDMLEPIHSLIRETVDADRAARVPADSQPAPANTRQIAECYGDCPTDPKTCANPCKFGGRASRAPADSVLEDAARLEALHAAVTAIYLDDSSDFKSALGAVVRHLDPKLAGDLLAWPKRAFDISQARLDAARKQGGAT